jgi:hemerythrin
MADNEETEEIRCEREDLIDYNIFIVWKPEYNLGIPIIDEQHRGIVSTINSLHYALQHNLEGNMLRPIINTVKEYTHIHFSIEEELLKKDGFLDFEYHCSLHRELMDSLDLIGDLSLEEHDSHKFMGFLKLWWIEHICEKDRVFRDQRIEKRNETQDAEYE